METLLQDLRYGFRMLTKKPGFTIVSVIALALGIGANTAIFSVINKVLLSPLSFEEPDRLIMAWGRNKVENLDYIAFSTAEFVRYRDENRSLGQIAAFDSDNYNLIGGDDPIRVEGGRATSSLFPLLGVRPLLGRTFSEEEDRAGGNQVVLLNENLWKRRFGADPEIIGKTIKIHLAPTLGGSGGAETAGEIFTVIGVLPNFDLPTVTPELWVPLAIDSNNLIAIRNSLRLIGRLKPGVTMAQAQPDLSSIADRLSKQYPEVTSTSLDLISLRDQFVGDIRPTLMLLLAGVLFVLLIACANIANLLLARSSERAKEIAVRTALGAGRLRIVRQLLTESILLSIIGGSFGLLLALWGVPILVSLSPVSIPRIKDVGIDAGVLVLTLSVSLLTGIIFGLAPALQASRPDLNEALKDNTRSISGGARRNRIRNIFVITEVALSLMLLVGSGLVIRSFIYLNNVDLGFNQCNVLTAEISLPLSKYDQPAQRESFYKELIEKVKAMPGVEAAGLTSLLPLRDTDMDTFITVENRPLPETGEALTVSARVVSPDYFRALGIPLLKGRYFTEEDLKTPGLIISEGMARKFFPGEDPVGKGIKLGRPERQEKFIPIAGVVSDVRQFGPHAEARPILYIPNIKQPSMTLVLRTVTDPIAFAEPLRQAVISIDKEQPLANIKSMEQRFSEVDALSQARFRTLLLAIFSITALILAAVGIYGVISYSVTQRTHEIGIRMALGAGKRDVLRLIIRQGMYLSLIGIAIGLVGSFALTRVISSLLFGVSATDPVTFTALSLLLGAVTLIACFIPARRATMVDPMVALRYE